LSFFQADYCHFSLTMIPTQDSSFGDLSEFMKICTEEPLRSDLVSIIAQVLQIIDDEESGLPQSADQSHFRHPASGDARAPSPRSLSNTEDRSLRPDSSADSTAAQSTGNIDDMPKLQQ
jgi:hypothetical protein